ncbi:MAG: DUF1109 domain-containing protein [Sphingopyxis sp.]|nr:DUF1109 domain-containing protein [Sphingopyxis sp.]
MITIPNPRLDRLIDGLTEDLAPVTRQRQAHGVNIVLAAWTIGAAALLIVMGLRHDWNSGMFEPSALLQIFWSAALGLVAIWFAVRMAMPGVGRDHGGWRWAAAVAATVPLAAIVALMAASSLRWAQSYPDAGMECLWKGMLAGSMVAAALTLWLRQGAPSSPERAGLVTGIAAGATGVTVVALHCPLDALMHVGIWHGATIMLAALIGRIALPPLLRW